MITWSLSLSLILWMRKLRIKMITLRVALLMKLMISLEVSYLPLEVDDIIESVISSRKSIIDS